MSNVYNTSFGEVTVTEIAEESDTKKSLKRLDVLSGHVHGSHEAAKRAEHNLHSADLAFKTSLSVTGADLEKIGREFGVNFAVNANPLEGFTLRMADGAEAAHELTVYQIMKGGYDGRKKLLTEFRRDHIDGLDDPFVTINFYMRDQAIQKLLGPLPFSVRPGSLQEWREKAWREEARRLIKNFHAYNPIHHEVASVAKRIVVREISEEEAQFHPRIEDVHLYKEDEVMDVTVTPVSRLPRIRYLDGFVRALEEVRTALGQGQT
ncbi:MAG: hypothetical protein HY053_02115 [Proteobacteria bacterium]|nr:hypothetical protein [Pseudomonadota bacterium]